VEIEYYDDPNLLQNRPWAEHTIVLMGGVVFNILLALTLYFGELSLGTGIPKPSFQSGAIITQVPRPGRPSVGILNKGDIILGFNGMCIFTHLYCITLNGFESLQSVVTVPHNIVFLSIVLHLMLWCHVYF